MIMHNSLFRCNQKISFFTNFFRHKKEVIAPLTTVQKSGRTVRQNGFNAVQKYDDLIGFAILSMHL